MVLSALARTNKIPGCWALPIERFALVRDHRGKLVLRDWCRLISHDERHIASGTYDACQAARRLMEMRDG